MKIVYYYSILFNRVLRRDRKGVEAKLEDDGDLTAAMGGGGQDDGALFADRARAASRWLRLVGILPS